MNNIKMLCYKKIMFLNVLILTRKMFKIVWYLSLFVFVRKRVSVSTIFCNGCYDVLIASMNNHGIDY